MSANLLGACLFWGFLIPSGFVWVWLSLEDRESYAKDIFNSSGKQETLWPKPKKVKPKPWVVWYVLNYDGGSTEWRGYYRTEIQARIASWWNCYISSWGGTAVLYYQGESNE